MRKRLRLITLGTVDRKLDWSKICALAKSTGGCLVGRVINRGSRRVILWHFGRESEFDEAELIDMVARHKLGGWVERDNGDLLFVPVRSAL